MKFGHGLKCFLDPPGAPLTPFLLAVVLGRWGSGPAVPNGAGCCALCAALTVTELSPLPLPFL